MTTPHSPPLPLVPGPWLPLDEAEAETALEHLDEHLAAAGLAAPPFGKQCWLHSLHAVPLSFYPGWVLITGQAELRKGGVRTAGSFDVLLGPGVIWCVDGHSGMIHVINAGLKSPVEGDHGDHDASDDEGPPPREGVPLAPLEPQRTGPDYLRFFCHAVRGDQGAFRVVETADDLAACGVFADIAPLVPRLKPLRMAWKSTRQRALTAEATLLYGGALFSAEFEIDARGMVNMVNDSVIATDIAPVEVTQKWLRNLKPIV